MTDILGRLSFSARPNNAESISPPLRRYARMTALRANLAPVANLDRVFLISFTEMDQVRGDQRSILKFN